MGSGGTLVTYTGSSGYSNLIFAIKQSSFSLFNYTSTTAGTLALLGNAILAIAGQFKHFVYSWTFFVMEHFNFYNAMSIFVMTLHLV